MFKILNKQLSSIYSYIWFFTYLLQASPPICLLARTLILKNEGYRLLSMKLARRYILQEFPLAWKLPVETPAGPGQPSQQKQQSPPFPSSDGHLTDDDLIDL